MPHQVPHLICSEELVSYFANVSKFGWPLVRNISYCEENWVSGPAFGADGELDWDTVAQGGHDAL